MGSKYRKPAILPTYQWKSCGHGAIVFHFKALFESQESNAEECVSRRKNAKAMREPEQLRVVNFNQSPARNFFLKQQEIDLFSFSFPFSLFFVLFPLNYLWKLGMFNWQFKVKSTVYKKHNPKEKNAHAAREMAEAHN